MEIQSFYQIRPSSEHSWLEFLGDKFLYFPRQLWQGRNITLKIDSNKLEVQDEKIKTFYSENMEIEQKMREWCVRNMCLDYEGLSAIHISQSEMNKHAKYELLNSLGFIFLSPLLFLGWACKKIAVLTDQKTNQYYQLVNTVLMEEEISNFKNKLENRIKSCSEAISDNELHKIEIEQLPVPQYKTKDYKCVRIGRYGVSDNREEILLFRPFQYSKGSDLQWCQSGLKTLDQELKNEIELTDTKIDEIKKTRDKILANYSS